MAKFRLPKFGRSKPTAAAPTPITLSEDELRDLINIINNPPGFSLDQVTNAVTRLREASYNVPAVPPIVFRILASSSKEFDNDNIKKAFLISIFVEETRQRRLYLIYTSCLRTIFSRTQPEYIRELWRFFDRHKGPNFYGYPRTKGVTESEVEAVVAVLISVFDRSVDEVQAALATLGKIGLNNLNEDIIHEAQEILDPNNATRDMERIKIAVEILVFANIDMRPYGRDQFHIIFNPDDFNLYQIERAFVILIYWNNSHAGSRTRVFSDALSKCIDLSDTSKMKPIWEFMIKHGGSLFEEHLRTRRHVTISEVESVINVLSSVFTHTRDELVAVLGIINKMGHTWFRFGKETIGKAVEILDDDDIMGRSIERVVVDRIKIACEILIWSKVNLTLYIRGSLNILSNIERNNVSVIKSASIIYMHINQNDEGQLYRGFDLILKSIFLLPDLRIIREIWLFYIRYGGAPFMGYLGSRKVSVSDVDNLVGVLDSIFEHKMVEVVSAQRTLRRLGYNTHSEGIIRRARVIMSDNIITKYTLEQFKIAWQILVFSNVWRTQIMYNRFHARVRFEKYPEQVTTTQFVNNLKALVAAYGNRVLNVMYMRTSGPTNKEVNLAISKIHGAHIYTNKEVKTAISVLKQVNIVLDKPNIDAQLVRLDNYRNFNPEQIKNIVSILEWNKVRVPLRLKSKINTWRDQLTRPDTINEVENVLDILDTEWKYFIRINYVAEKLKKFAENRNKMRVQEMGKSRKYLRELKWFERREQMWDSVDKLKGKVNEMLKLGMFDRHDIYDIESYLEQLKVDESKVIYDTGVDLNKEIAEKEPLLVDWPKVKTITADILKWSTAFIAVDQQLRDLIKRKGKKRTRGF